MNKINLDLLEEAEDENVGLLDFYQKNEEFLNGIHLDEVPTGLKQKMGIILHVDSSGGPDWKICLEELKLDKYTIDKVEFSASNGKSTPLHIALEEPLRARNISFGKIMKVFIKTEKFRILKIAKEEFIEGLINQYSVSTENVEPPSAPLYKESTVDESFRTVSEFHGKQSSQDYLSTNTPYPCHNVQLEHTDTNRKSHDHFQKCNKQEQSPIVSKASKLELPLSHKDVVSVFILHDDTDSKQAAQIRSFLKAHNCKVVTLSAANTFLRSNPTKMLKDINSKVDFIIPVLSEVFMDQIRPTKKQNCIDASSPIYFMYNLAENEYLCQGCENYRVRAVRIPHQKIQVENEPILSWYFRFPKERYELIRNLKETKLWVKKYLLSLA